MQFRFHHWNAQKIARRNMHLCELVNFKAAHPSQCTGLFNIVAPNQIFAYFLWTISSTKKPGIAVGRCVCIVDAFRLWGKAGLGVAILYPSHSLLCPHLLLSYTLLLAGIIAFGKVSCWSRLLNKTFGIQITKNFLKKVVWGQLTRHRRLVKKKPFTWFSNVQLSKGSKGNGRIGTRSYRQGLIRRYDLPALCSFLSMAEVSPNICPVYSHPSTLLLPDGSAYLTSA